MNKKSTANVNVMLMIELAGLDATNALKISSEVNLRLEMKEKSQKKSRPYQ